MTKSPWVAQHWHASTQNGGSVLEYTIHDADGNKVADFVKPEVVNIMTVAPELLEALENFVNFFELNNALPHETKEYKEYKDAIKTILKAKVEQL